MQLFFYPTKSDCSTIQSGDMRSQNTWLIHSSCLPLPSKIELRVDSNVYSYQLEANGSVIVHELYKVSVIHMFSVQHNMLCFKQVFPSDPITMRYSFTFDGWKSVPENMDLGLTGSSSLIENRSDLKGRNIRLCALPFPQTTMSDDGGKNFYGFSIDIIGALAETMNFTYSYILPGDGQWGTQNPITGSWNGMIGMLIDGKCDIWYIHHHTRHCYNLLNPNHLQHFWAFCDRQPEKGD